MPRDTNLDEREVEPFLRGASSPREELVYRLALKSISPGLADYRFRQRLDELSRLVEPAEIGQIPAEAAQLEAKLAR